jgi:RNA recognition motif-containing protein
MFASAGHIVRADVVTQGGRHRGMATVEFSNKDEVQRAISQFHQTRIDDREIFVRQDNPPPGARKERGDRYDDRRDRYGDREASYGRDRFNDRGYGRGDRYGGRDRYDDRRDYGRDRFGDRDTRPKLLNGPHYEVFVGNLPFSARWQDLKDLFKEVGDVIRADVKVDEYSGRSRGFGMVYFATQEDVQTAIERFNNYEMDGRRLDVRAGKKNSDTSPPERSGAPSNSEFTENVEGDGPQNDTIFVDNLPFATNNQDLIDLFGTIENVVKAEIIYTAGGRPAGCGVIQFESETAADAAIDKLNNYNYGGRDLKVSFAKRP